MANTLLTPTIVAKEALIALENNMVLGNLVHRAYSAEFQNVGATIQIRKPTSFTASAWASTIAVQSASEATVSVALDTLFDVSFEVTTQELTHDIKDFSEQFIQPAMRAHAQAIDASIAALYANISGNYPVTSTPTVSDITGIGAVLNVQKVPTGDRRLVMHPLTEAAYMALDAFLHADKRADGGQALRQASMGRVLGFDCYMDQNIPKHTATTTNAATALVNGSTFAAAGTTLIFDNHVTTAGTAAAGDVLKIGDDEWCLAVGGTWATNAGTIITSKRLGAVSDNEVITFYGTHRSNLAFHKNAFALVTAPLHPPLGGVSAAVLNYKGISCRVVYDYSSLTKKNTVSIDQLIGVKTLNKDLAARLMDAR